MVKTFSISKTLYYLSLVVKAFAGGIFFFLSLVGAFLSRPERDFPPLTPLGFSLASHRSSLCAVANTPSAMEETVLNELQILKLTKEEGKEISITNTSQDTLLEECSLSLFGKLLSDRQQNAHALKHTLRTAWKLGSDLRIVNVGNDIL